MIKNNVCNNCGKHGHMFSSCKYPIISYGVVLFCKINDEYKYLMIRRKNSFGFVDFIRGKYSLDNKYHLMLLINEMSLEEKGMILEMSYDELYKKMWNNSEIYYKNDDIIAKQKFELLRGLILDDSVSVRLDELVRNSDSAWCETEWEFPKGRRNYQERDINCALREFREETGIVNDVSLIENILPFEEIFIGSNYKSYKHKFFLAHSQVEITSLQNYQKSEIGCVKWGTISECVDRIRPYHLEKKQLITNINNVLEEYSIY